jgi:hypothetical protein
MNRIPAIIAAGIVAFAFGSSSHATQLASTRYLSNSTASDALELQNSLNDFRTFLRYGCADTRGNSGGSRLAGSFTICGSDAIESANRNMHRALVLSSLPEDGLKLYTGVDNFDFKHGKYKSRMDWVGSALDRRDSRQAAMNARASIVAPVGTADDGMGATQVASLVLNGNDESGNTVASDTTATGPYQVGDNVSGDASNLASSAGDGSSVPTAAGGTVTEYTDEGSISTGSDGAIGGDVVASLGVNGSVAAGSGSVIANDGAVAQGLSSDNAGVDGTAVDLSANDATAADGTAGDGTDPALQDGVVVSDMLDDGEAIASVDGVPSTSESFFVQLDPEQLDGAGGSASDVPLPAALPLFAGAIALFGGMRQRQLSKRKVS